MKITITGALGNVGKPLAEILVKNGHELTLISNDSSKKSDIEALGAKSAIGSVGDVSFLTNAFKGADAVYTMVPPNWSVSNYVQYIADTGKNYLQAIKASGVKRVVNLSSIGAHLSEGNGAIAGLHAVEQTLNTLDGVAIKHLRPGLFYVNFFFDIPVIRNMGIMGNNYGKQSKLVIVHPRDIAVAAAQELQGSFEGKSHRYIPGEELEVADIVKILGSAIDKPELPWVEFSDKETLAGMIAAGMSEAIASLYVEMGRAIGSGILFEDFRNHRPEAWGKIKLREFAIEFAAVY
jgi:uncharacterized protein YbjT (DUF2867 family)